MKIRAVMGWLFACVLLAIELARALSGEHWRVIAIAALEFAAICQLVQAIRISE